MKALAFDNNRSKLHPKKFALFVACASMMMMFAGLTSAYIIRQAAGNWLEFALPSLFYVNTIVMLLSSVILQASYSAFIKENARAYKGLLVLGFIMGLAFIVLQYQAWVQMDVSGVAFNGNPSGSFVYVLSGIHATHVLGGITALIIALVHAFVLPMRVTPRRKLRFEMTLIFWHFVDALWIYLLLFFILQQP